MKILVLNSGSSSIKYQVFDIEGERFTPLAKGLVDRIGLDGANIRHTTSDNRKYEKAIAVPHHRRGIRLLLEALTCRTGGVLKDLQELGGIGHRVVHGAESFSNAVRISPEVMQAVHDCIELAPLHNPPTLAGIEACREVLPEVPMVAVFDTAFHQTMPAHAFLYALPLDYYRRMKIRRYGFHGTSHGYVAAQAARALQRPLSELKLVTCHLGNGCSLAAVRHGQSIDTTMGFTPLEGVAMGSRSGDLDPYVPLYLMEKESLNAGGLNDLLNKRSGLLGLCGHRDMRDLEASLEKGCPDSRLAFEVFCYRVAKYIGAFAVAMGGIDAVVFTAGIGENSPRVRTEVVKNMEFLGLRLNEAANREKQTVITHPDSRVKALVIPTNEELVIARDTYRIIREGK